MSYTTAATVCIILAGPPCSGKSTLARHLAERHSLRWIQMDEVLSNLMPYSDRSEQDRLVGYRGMLLVAEELLRCNRAVVLDATFTSAVCRALLQAWTERLGAPVQIIQVQVSTEVAVRRFRARQGHLAADLDEVRVRKLASEYPYSKANLIVDGDGALEDNLRTIERMTALQSEP